MCDCVIGYLHNFVRKSEIVELLHNEANAWNRHAETMRAVGGDPKKYKTGYKAKDFLDRRKGLLTMFNYCPYCADKIDWKKIKQAI